MTAKATFAAGCFWGVEHKFRHVPGVISVISGYTGGQTDKPTYKQVCSGATGHAEAVEVTFDPKRVSFEGLLEVFWHLHDPTTPDRQGPDIGTQYRSAIFCHDQGQRLAAEKSLENQQQILSKKIVTEIAPARIFWPAEEYHQRYIEKHGGVCHA